MVSLVLQGGYRSGTGENKINLVRPTYVLPRKLGIGHFRFAKPERTVSHHYSGPPIFCFASQNIENFPSGTGVNSEQSLFTPLNKLIVVGG